MTVPEFRLGVSSVAASAVFQVDETTRGVLIPRMTTTQRDAISSPAASLLIYNTTTSAYNAYIGGGWVALSSFATGSMTSAQLAAMLTDETGTAGSAVFSTAPTLTGVVAVTSTFADPVATTRALNLQATQTLTGASAIRIDGALISATLSNGTSNNTNATGTIGANVSTTISGSSGTVTSAIGALVGVTATGGVTLTSGYGLRLSAASAAAGSTITSYAGWGVGAQTSATNNTYILLGTTTIPSGNWGIHSITTNDNALAGNTSFGKITAPVTVIDVLLNNATTAAVDNVATIGHDSTGTAAAGFGGALLMNLESSTTAAQNAALMSFEWVVATHASRTARVKHVVYDTAAREYLRGEASGSAAMIGFLGTAAVVKQTSGADLTNNVTSGGSNDVIADFTSLSVYATDAATIRNDIYQLARKLKQVNDALRLYGLLT